MGGERFSGMERRRWVAGGEDGGWMTRLLPGTWGILSCGFVCFVVLKSLGELDHEPHERTRKEWEGKGSVESSGEGGSLVGRGRANDAVSPGARTFLSAKDGD